MTKNNPLLKAALDYGRRGWKIFPILEGTKDQPLIRQWGVRASSDADQITKWWTKWPDANIGLACMLSGIGVVESDPPDEQDALHGEETLRNLENFEGKRLTDTLMAKSPRGGNHYFYRGRVATTVGKIGPNVDTRGVGSGNGGYVVLAPSRRPEGLYEWINDLPVADIDQWVVETCGASIDNGPAPQEPLVEWDEPVNVERFRDFLANDAKPSKQGAGGDANLLQVAVIGKDMAISEELCGELMAEIWNTRCEPPWQLGDCDPKDNLFVKVHNAYLYCRDNPPGINTAEADFGADPEPQPTKEEKREQEKIREKNDAMVVRGKRPMVVVSRGNLPKAARKTKKLLIEDSQKPDCAASDMLFRRGTLVAHLSRNALSEEDQDRGHDEEFHVVDDLLVRNATKHWLGDRAERAIYFCVLDEDKDGKTIFVPIDAPDKLMMRVTEIITKQDFPKLTGTVEAPTLRRDHSLLVTPGYDKKSGLFYDLGHTTFPEISDKPTKGQARAALELFTGPRGILHDFPFTDAPGEPKGLSLAVAVAMLLTSVARRCLPYAPMFCIDAFEAQSGKTLLGMICGALAVGRKIAARSWQTDEYQRHHALAMALETGDPVLLFDNLGPSAPLEGDTFNLAITSEFLKTRRLGSNTGKDEIYVPTNALLIGTGNHLVVQGDMAEGRVLISKIVPDRPLGQRSFLYRNLLDHVLEHRPQLVAGLLTILRGYVAAKDKREPTKFRLREWGDLIAASVAWLGLPDPCLAEQRSQGTDPERELQNSVVRAWAAAFGEKWITVPELISRDTVGALIAGAVNVPKDKLSWQKAEPFIRTLEGVVRLGLRAERIKGDHHNPTRWRLATVSEHTAPLAPEPDAAEDFSADPVQAEEDFGA